MDGIDGTREDTEDTTILSVQIEEVKCPIRTLSFVTKLSPVDTHNDKSTGRGFCFTCYSCPDYCGKTRSTSSTLA